MGSSIGFQTPTRQEWHLTSTHGLTLPSKRSLVLNKNNPLELKMKFVVALMMMTFMVYCTVAQDAQGINDVQEDGDDLQLETVDLDEEVRAGRAHNCRNCGQVLSKAYFCESKECQECIMDGKPGQCRPWMKCVNCGQVKNTDLFCDSDFCQKCPKDKTQCYIRHQFEGSKDIQIQNDYFFKGKKYVIAKV